MLSPAASYDAIYADFAWSVPRTYNIAQDTCGKWAEHQPDRTAILDLTGGKTTKVSFGQLDETSDAIAAHLRASGIECGDRVGVFRGQSGLTAAAHLAIFKLGAISVPLFSLFRQEALTTRLLDSGTRLILTAPETSRFVDDILHMVPTLEQQIILEEVPQTQTGFTPVQTKATDPAILIYTSGTTGAPKGAVLPHQTLLGHLPGVELSHDFLGQKGDCIWTPADWAWIGGLLDVLLPGLQLGVPVVATQMEKFDPIFCKRVIEQNKVRNVFFPPTALKLLKAGNVHMTGLRSVASGGEPLGTELLDWGRQALGVTINEFYGQTECNMIVSNCNALFASKPGMMGRPVPGHTVAIVDKNGNPTNTEGDIAVRRGSPVMMSGYWNNPKATKEKFRGDWLITGDRGRLEDGYIRFLGRLDDIITSAGYRIGPSAIENCLLSHPKVAAAAVVGKPDPIRTEIIKAYVQLKPDQTPNDTLASELQSHVRTLLSAHEYPREVAFVDRLPMTVTSKIIRKELKARARAEAQAEAN